MPTVAEGNWTQLTITLAHLNHLVRSPAGLQVLSMANYDDKAIDTLRTLWKSNWEVFLSFSAHHPFYFCSNSPWTTFAGTVEGLE